MSTGATSLGLPIGHLGGKPAASKAADSGRPAVSSWAGSAGLLGIAIQLVLIDLLVFRLDLFTPSFRRILLFAGPAFLIHHWTPRPYRLRVFAALSIAALLLFFGGSPDAFWSPVLALERSVPILVAGAVLAGICVLPIPFWSRAAALAGAGGAIAAFRSGFLLPSSLALVWPVLAGLFMFRVIVFFYQTSTMPKRPTLSESVAYFFLIPNLTVGLFPVIDFKRFVRSYYEIADLEIYEHGARTIGKGILQLVLYRLIQQLLIIGPADVASGRDLAQYILANAFLYLKVSGQFHIFIGMLMLFGFNLPEANRRYFLASSFTDYWRRVNVYWKDFILTVFYYPAYFRLKRFGATWALVLATLWSFFVTWALHLYQTWWLKGSAQMTWPDVLFWSILALLVLANSLWETRRGRLRKLASSTYSLKDVVGLTLRTGGTFTVVCLLWSLWSTPTLRQWIGLWRFADLSAFAWFGLAVVGVMAATIVLEVLPPVFQKRARRASVGGAMQFGRFALGAAPLVVMLLASSGHVQAAIDSAALQPVEDAFNTGDSMVDDLIVRNGGYYEHLTSTDGANAALWQTLNYERLPETYEGPDPIRTVHDFRFYEFLPNVRTSAYDIADFRTNQWGMRDADRVLAKAPGTVRIAVLGASHAMGWGVPAESTFEAVLERRLNAEAAASGSSRHFEVLNLAGYGRSPLAQIPFIPQSVAPFRPDIVLLVSHTVDVGWVSRDLAKGVRLGFDIHDGVLRNMIAQARLTPRTNQFIAKERTAPLERDLLQWCYGQVKEESEAIGATAAVVFLPAPLDLPMDPAKAAKQTALVQKAGVELVDFTHLWDGQNAIDLMRLPDHHINAKAHAQVADALHDALLRQPALRQRMGAGPQ